jgi:hypothetical protein
MPGLSCRPGGGARGARSWEIIPGPAKTFHAKAQRREGAKKTKQFVLANLCASASPISGVRSTPSESCNRTLREIVYFFTPSVAGASRSRHSCHGHPGHDGSRAGCPCYVSGHGQDARATSRVTGRMPVLRLGARAGCPLRLGARGRMPVPRLGSRAGCPCHGSAHGRDARATAGETPMNRGRLPALPPPSPRRRPHRASWQAVSGRRLSTCSGDAQNGSAICG